MVVANYAKNRINLFIGGSGQTPPSFFIIGSGSGTALPTQTELIAPTDRQAVTSTTFPGLQKVKWQGDWNSVEMSGTNLKEWGMILSGAGFTGSIWSRAVLIGRQFDGTNELRIEETWEVF